MYILIDFVLEARRAPTTKTLLFFPLSLMFFFFALAPAPKSMFYCFDFFYFGVHKDAVHKLCVCFTIHGFMDLRKRGPVLTSAWRSLSQLDMGNDE
jgi:hypothetical protein